MGRRWRARRRPGERERRCRGLGVEDVYGQSGEREAQWCSWGEGDVDMGRRWQVRQRPGEQEPRCRGLGVGDAYGRHGERDARCCSWERGTLTWDGGGVPVSSLATQVKDACQVSVEQAAATEVDAALAKGWWADHKSALAKAEKV